jgi:hypothetical protein
MEAQTADKQYQLGEEELHQRFIDPHFHFWDLPPQTNAGAHNPTWLGT